MRADRAGPAGHGEDPRPSSALALAAALVVAACGAGAPGTALPTTQTSPDGPGPSIASASPSPAVPDASPAAPSAVSSPSAPAIVGPVRTSGPGTAATTAVPTPIGAVTVAPSPAAPSPAVPSAIDPRADGLDIACRDVAVVLEAPVIRPGPVTLIIHNAGGSTAGFEMKIPRGGGARGSGARGDGSGGGDPGGDGSGGGDTQIETRTFGPGETLRVEANLPPGLYEAECSRRDQASDGQPTTLEVRADAPLVTASAAAAHRGTVRIVQYAFVAPSLDVPAGSRVTWTNVDPAPHTVTADHGAFDSRQLDPGASFSVVLDRPGVYTYHCDIHRTMVGTVIVH